MEGVDDATRTLRSTLESSAASGCLSGSSSALELEAPPGHCLTVTQQVGEAAMRMAEAVSEAAIAHAGGGLSSSETSGSTCSEEASAAASMTHEQHQAIGSQVPRAQHSFTSLVRLPSDLEAYDITSSITGIDSLAGDEVGVAAVESSSGSVF
jgi:hypothetical protein